MEKLSFKAVREEMDKKFSVEEASSRSPFEQLVKLSNNIDKMTEDVTQEIDEFAVIPDLEEEPRAKSFAEILENIKQSTETIDEDLAAILARKPTKEMK